jgi:putative ABC transport system permease protein
MVISALNRKLLRDLWHLRGQVLATALLVAGGVAVLIMSQGTLLSLLDTRDAYYERYRFADVFATLKRAPDSLADRIKEVPGVKWVETRIVEGATLDLPDVVEPASATLVSISPNARPILNGLVLRKGRWIEPDHPDEVLISEAFAEANALGPGKSFYALINGHRRALRIVGVALSPEYIYSLGPGFLVPDNRRFGVVWMSHDALEAAFDLEGAFNNVALSLLRHASVDAAIEHLDKLLAPYGGTGAYGRKDQLSHAFLKGELDQLQAIGKIIPPIFLGVAAFLLHVLATRVVQTEREQIGILKAFGYTQAAVGWHYLKFVLSMTLVGVVAGCIVGVLFGRSMTELYAEFYRFPFLYFRLNAGVFVTATAVSLGAGGIGALAAVRGAVRLAPAVAMQVAPPASYTRGGMEAFSVVRSLSQPSRMILRHILRWPGRAAITTVGLSLSVALLVSTLFFFDATDAMIDAFFYQSRHQDVSVRFVESAHPSVVEDVARLPGVLVAEGARDVSARIHFGSRSKRTGITALNTGGTLVNVLDANLEEVSAPEFGILLTSQLAKNIGAGPGDRVTVEILQDKRPVAEVPVVGIVEDYIGNVAYMRKDVLDRLMGEGPRVSSVDVRIDGDRATAFYRSLKQTPAISGVTLWRVALQGFKDTMAQSMYIVITFYVAFGSAIAFGVAYNSARIALSERGRELATLRVIGFTRLEVSYILLGEIVLLMLPALPLGCLLGYGLALVMVENLSSDLFRIPLVIGSSTYAMACLAVIAATFLSGLLVRRRIDELDLIAVLKTRE